MTETLAGSHDHRAPHVLDRLRRWQRLFMHSMEDIEHPFDYLVCRLWHPTEGMEAAAQVASEGDAYRYFETLRWNGEPVCAHCESRRVYYLTPANGVDRRTRTGGRSERRVWKCGSCHRQFSALTGTTLHGTRTSPLTWLLVAVDTFVDFAGASAEAVERKYDLSPATAALLTRRIREATTRAATLEEILSRLLSLDPQSRPTA